MATHHPDGNLKKKNKKKPTGYKEKDFILTHLPDT